ncbi:MAG: helix-turn-helix domain-containing protein [Sporichthyaceae bacterium]
MIPLYTTTAAAEVLNVSAGWLREQVRLRQVPHTVIGNRVRFTEHHLEEIVADGQRRPAPDQPAASSPTGRRIRRHPAIDRVPAQTRRLGS